MKAYIRLVRMLLHAFLAVATGIFRYPFWGREKRRQYIRTWSQTLFKIIGIRIKVIHEDRLASDALIVSNHLSWLDIFLINTVQPSRFIAKDAIRQWPLIGWLATKAGTVYLKRNNARDLRNTFRILVACLKEGDFFVFFPEGTSGGNQNKLFPFIQTSLKRPLKQMPPFNPVYCITWMKTTAFIIPLIRKPSFHSLTTSCAF
jgi:1-acyl-sn-glycerol-3-phosphate acyltransferase